MFICEFYIFSINNNMILFNVMAHFIINLSITMYIHFFDF